MSGLIALRKIREDKGWTQPDLAKRIGVSFETISRWERGEKEPRKQHRDKLAKVTGIPFHKLLADSVQAGGRR